MTSIINASTSSGVVTTADTSGVLALQTANTTAVTITSGQSVGIGTTIPYVPLQVTGTIKVATGNAQGILSLGDGNGASTNCGIYRGAAVGPTTDGNYLNIGGYDGIVFTTGAAAIASQTERMRIDSSGNVGIGLNPTGVAKLEINSTSTQLNITDQTSTGNGNKTVSLTALKNGVGYHNLQYTAYQHIWLYGGSATEGARIDSGGNFLVGTASSTAKVVAECGNAYAYKARIIASGGVAFSVDYTQSTGTILYGYWNYNGANIGSIVNNGTSAVTYATTSDYRLKENIAPMIGALETVSKLKPVTYNWKIDGSNGQGFIAHELQAVVPECVVGEKDAVHDDGSINPQAIDTSFLVATLTAAIQEQQALITQLQADVQALKGAK